MKACRNCRLIVREEKKCPRCEGELTDKFSGMLIIIDPERSEIAKIVEANVVGSYAIKVK
ncbi:MAG: transcription elongation factor subunit Spt4 [Candidatus Bilamarchaeaceae archaeon]